jgi:hypothetical protein
MVHLYEVVPCCGSLRYKEFAMVSVRARKRSNSVELPQRRKHTESEERERQREKREREREEREMPREGKRARERGMVVDHNHRNRNTGCWIATPKGHSKPLTKILRNTPPQVLGPGTGGGYVPFLLEHLFGGCIEIGMRSWDGNRFTQQQSLLKNVTQVKRMSPLKQSTILQFRALRDRS